ncbi:MAG: alanine--tRNA ligase, partial [Proteobacteria bacterium]
SGAMALFGEKYGEKVRVVEIGPQSLELCGGTHVARSGDIGFLMVAHEASIAAGVRRIECWAGSEAETHLLSERSERARIAELLKSDSHNLPEKIEKLLRHSRELERELGAARGKMASAASSNLASEARISPQGIKVIVAKVDVGDTDTLRSMVDRLRVSMGSGVVALGGLQGDKAVIVAGVTSDLTKSINAGNLVKEAANFAGGKGGGRADFAQAGGLDPSKLSDSLDKIYHLIG